MICITEGFEMLFGNKFVDKHVKFFLDSNEKREIDRFDDTNRIYLTFKEDGIEFVLNEKRVLTTINFYGPKNKARYKSYKYDLPFGFTFKLSQAEVRKKYGNPDINTGSIPALNIFEVDIYKYPNYQISIDYNQIKSEIASLQLTIEKFPDHSISSKND